MNFMELDFGTIINWNGYRYLKTDPWGIEQYNLTALDNDAPVPFLKIPINYEVEVVAPTSDFHEGVARFFTVWASKMRVAGLRVSGAASWVDEDIQKAYICSIECTPGTYGNPQMEQTYHHAEVAEYKYTLTSTGASSTKYGNCEVCKKHVSEVFHQREEMSFYNPIKNHISWTYHGCRNLFGHKDCLISKRR